MLFYHALTGTVPGDAPKTTKPRNGEKVQPMHKNNSNDNLDVMNPAPRCPVVLLLDASGSMSGQPINELNAAVKQFIRETQGDEAASMSVDLEVIAYADDAERVLPFTPIANVSALPGDIDAAGMTSMGKAIEMAEADLRTRRELYRAKGISSYRPWVVLMTDGGPNDSWEAPADRFRRAAERGKFQYIGIEIGNDADHATMCRIVPAEPGPVKLQGLRFKQFFRWLTDSLKSVSASAVSDQDAVQYGDVSSWADLNALCA